MEHSMCGCSRLPGLGVNHAQLEVSIKEVPSWAGGVRERQREKLELLLLRLTLMLCEFTLNIQNCDLVLRH